jgi:methyl coenzyme M reductase system subunit A2
MMVSHHVDFIEEVATRAIMMEDGKLVEQGETKPLCQEFIARCHAKYLEKEAV